MSFNDAHLPEKEFRARHEARLLFRSHAKVQFVEINGRVVLERRYRAQRDPTHVWRDHGTVRE
jgi:hypothetical protein